MIVYAVLILRQVIKYKIW